MRLVSAYRVGYKGKFYEAGHPFHIDDEDIEEMKQHGTLLKDRTPTPPSVNNEQRKPGRPRRTDDGQSGKAKAQDG